MAEKSIYQEDLTKLRRRCSRLENMGRYDQPVPVELDTLVLLLKDAEDLEKAFKKHPELQRELAWS